MSLPWKVEYGVVQPYNVGRYRFVRTQQLISQIVVLVRWCGINNVTLLVVDFRRISFLTENNSFTLRKYNLLPYLNLKGATIQSPGVGGEYFFFGGGSIFLNK